MGASKTTTEFFKDGSTVSFIPANEDVNKILGFEHETMKEMPCVEQVHDTHGNCKFSKHVAKLFETK